MFPSCCGYAESLAVDSTGLAQIAFWSNATGQSGYVYGPVGGPYSNLTGGKESLSNNARVLDDGFPVAGAALTGGGKTLRMNGTGRASLAG